eukprot:TRINITY_DN7964_c0_g2_i1.p1 TRINITY_DN7964_c0_g2~~TRINITY_DN7964_c0_g2_i1.p1  ORF type:complete len:330 (+),score=43.46 TRINITY_DN7964_c0_g2_i1:114-992(+)
MANSQVGMNDAVLIISLIYLSIDIQYEWEGFSSCKRPIHQWLLVSYGLVVMSRMVHVAGVFMSRTDGEQQGQEGHDFMLDLRAKSSSVKLLSSVMWLVIVPLFAAWSVVGSYWIWDIRTSTPECLPGGAHLWFLCIWQLLSYLWIIIHGGLGVVAWYLERRLRTAEGDLRQLEDQDLLQRWGQVSRLQGYTSVPGLPGAKEAGLSAAEISELPGLMTIDEPAEGGECEDCPICLTELQPGENARQLKMCGHTFHRSCIDLWLYRRNDCPLCKTEVPRTSTDAPQKTEATLTV